MEKIFGIVAFVFTTYIAIKGIALQMPLNKLEITIFFIGGISLLIHEHLRWERMRQENRGKIPDIQNIDILLAKLETPIATKTNLTKIGIAGFVSLLAVLYYCYKIGTPLNQIIIYVFAIFVVIVALCLSILVAAKTRYAYREQVKKYKDL